VGRQVITIHFWFCKIALRQTVQALSVIRMPQTLGNMLRLYAAQQARTHACMQTGTDSR